MSNTANSTPRLAADARTAWRAPPRNAYPALAGLQHSATFSVRKPRRTALHALASALCALQLGACGMPTSERVMIADHDGDCAQCHADEWSNTRSPPHAQAQLDQACVDCHTTRYWTPADGYQHITSFPLTLGHSDVACTSCHVQGFGEAETSAACASCHAADAARVSDPVHAGLTNDCFACHRTDAFWPAHFVHSWPLRGKHMLTSCRSCHAPGDAGATNYEQTPSACLSCHSGDKAHADSVVTGHTQYSDNCAECHGFDKF